MLTTDLPLAISDPDRLAALERYAILDTPAEPGFDDIVHLACQLCTAPVALVSLVTGDRQWFKARAGFTVCETDLGSSVCAHALGGQGDLLVISDLLADARTRGNPLVTGEPFIRFYAGAPLLTPEGHVLGSLCVIDKVPRAGGLTEAQADCLKALARQVVTLLELRRAVATRDAVRAQEARAYQAREALRDTQAAVAAAEGDLDAALHAVVMGAMRAIPAAEGGVFELIDGDELEYRAVRGTLLPHRGLRLSLPGTIAGQCALSVTSILVDDEMRDPRLNNEVVRRIGQCAALFVPVTRGNRVLGVVKLQSSRPAAFTETDLALLELFAGAGSNGLTAAEARAEIRAQEIYWRGLFDRLNEGFLVGEVVRDAEGRAVDWRYMEVNPAWGTLVGVDPKAVVGRSIREVFPGIEDAWVDEFVHVVETGEPAVFTRQVDALRRWYEGRAFKLDGNHFGVIFLEVTARVEADRRRAALLSLGDRLRDLTSIPEMTRAAAEVVGQTLAVVRAGFGHIVGDTEFIDIDPDWTALGIASIAGRHRFEDYGDLRNHLRRGEPLVIDDVTTDARTRANPDSLLAISVGALVNMPVRERGRAVAMLLVHDVAARAWTPEELAFLRNVADRIEVGVARVRAEDMQTVLNRELSHRLKNTLAVVQSIARQSLRDVGEREIVEAFENRVLAMSRAHDVLLEKSWLAARMRSVVENVLAMQADLNRFTLEGPDLNISPEAALSLSLLLHELATNALKYGALSAAAGRVDVAWCAEDGAAPNLKLSWTESGGPAATAPSGRTGFGSKLIRMGLVGTRDCELHYGPMGLSATFRAPMASVQTEACR